MKKVLLTAAVFLTTSIPFGTMASSMTLEQVLQRVVDKSLDLEVARLKKERSGLEKEKFDSMLGWQVSGQSSYSHDIGFGSIPQDTMRFNGNIARVMPNGSVVGIGGGYSYANADAALFPILPNPSHDANIDISYRHPLLRGLGLPSYRLGKKIAALGEDMTDLQRFFVQDAMARQTVDVFYSLVAIQIQMKNAEDAIERSRRLLKYNKRNKELGLSEQKDILQMNAQIKAREADLEVLKIAHTSLVATLNQFMNADPIGSVVADAKLEVDALPEYSVLFEAAVKWSPSIKLSELQIAMAESQISIAGDKKRDKLDGFATLGGRAKYGDSATGTVNEQDYAFSVGLDFQRKMDNRDIGAEISQYRIDIQVAQRELEMEKTKLKYELSRLVAEMNETSNAIKELNSRLDKEQQKLDEGVERYRRGRADTQQLIFYENDLSFARLALEQQKVELAKKFAKLSVVSGNIWQRVVPLEKAGE
ncbi:MAG: TolC family protein [Gammaproteobacteria bacterium]|nr:TolC family protein [Gammaproteobacteria bacterium]